MTALRTLLSHRLRRGEEGQGRSWRNRAAATEQGARDLRERRQRRVALERLRERRDARLADPAAVQAAANEEGQGCSWRDRAAGTEQGARDLLEPRQRRVDLERLRKRRGALIADPVVRQAAARRGGSGMLVARQGRRHRAGRARLTRATSASR
jgi:hypothetical protein